VLDRLRPGEELEVMTPTGRFGSALPGLKRPGFVAAGSWVPVSVSCVLVMALSPS